MAAAAAAAAAVAVVVRGWRRRHTAHSTTSNCEGEDERGLERWGGVRCDLGCLAVVGPKGWAFRPSEGYVSWVHVPDAVRTCFSSSRQHSTAPACLHARVFLSSNTAIMTWDHRGLFARTCPLSASLAWAGIDTPPPHTHTRRHNLTRARCCLPPHCPQERSRRRRRRRRPRQWQWRRCCTAPDPRGGEGGGSSSRLGGGSRRRRRPHACGGDGRRVRQ